MLCIKRFKLSFFSCLYDRFIPKGLKPGGLVSFFWAELIHIAFVFFLFNLRSDMALKDKKNPPPTKSSLLEDCTPPPTLPPPNPGRYKRSVPLDFILAVI